eukprot:scaffold2004_cov420-Prasinococcus_capsulatus_cf.AAC.14
MHPLGTAPGRFSLRQSANSLDVRPGRLPPGFAHTPSSRPQGREGRGGACKATGFARGSSTASFGRCGQKCHRAARTGFRTTSAALAFAGGAGGGTGNGNSRGSGGGGGDDDGYPEDQNENVHLDRWKPPWRDYFIGFVVTTTVFLSKSLVCWCAGNSELAAVAIDLGFLCFLGPVAWFTRNGPYQSFRHIVCAIMLMQMVYECLFNGVLLKHVIDNNTTYRGMDAAMWAHHLGTISAGIFCCFLGKGQFYKIGGYLIAVEVTTALPVAFRNAIQSRKLKGNRSIALGIGMPLAFIWRSGMCILGYRRFLVLCQKIGHASIPYWWMGGGGIGVVCLTNFYWTYKVIQGVCKQLGKRKKATKLTGTAELNDSKLAIQAS